MYCARRSCNAEQFFDCLAVTQAIGNRGNVVHSIKRRDELPISLVLAQFLHSTMQISDDALRIDHAFAVQLQLYLQHAVRGGMLRSHADG